jgi:ATP-dependent RNA helicase DDX52/ROK1
LARNAAVSTVEQKLLFVGNESGKILAIRQLLQQGVRPSPLSHESKLSQCFFLFLWLIPIILFYFAQFDREFI